MGGRIWVESEARQGQHVLTSTIRLRDRASGRCEREHFDPANLQWLARPDRGRQRDQSPHPAETARHWGMPTCVAASGSEALAELRRGGRERRSPFRSCLLDAMMPEMDGFMVWPSNSRKQPDWPASRF